MMDKIEKSEQIRKKMNDAFSKTIGRDIVMCPKFTGMPVFYYELDKFLDGDLMSVFKVMDIK
jgi:hypothetical protein